MEVDKVLLSSPIYYAFTPLQVLSNIVDTIALDGNALNFYHIYMFNFY
jgi:hypothetical protein